MLNETPAEPGGWKNKLDGPDGMAGEPWTGKEAAWDRLHTRLHKKPAKKRGMWWLAAAVFLLVPAPTQPPPMGEALRPPQLVRVEHAHRAIVNTVADAERPATAKQVTAKTKKTSLLIDKPADTVQQIIIPEAIKTDTPLLASVPAPRKLRVIHINELEDAAAVTTAVAPAMAVQARRYVMPTFRFVLTHTEAPGTVSYEKTSTGNNPLKIKIPTQN